MKLCECGHRYARLAHVGDRTGLEMIRTLQQRAVALGIDVFMECTVTELFTEVSTGSTTGAGSTTGGRPRIAGAFGGDVDYAQLVKLYG